MAKAYVTLTAEEYKVLIEDQLLLEKLYDHGVDNWEGYGDALEDYHSTMEKTVLFPVDDDFN